MRTPVTRRYSALPVPTIRGNRWVPPSTYGTPHRRDNAPNSAVDPATRMSHQAASSSPPAKQYPSTAAMVGLPGSSEENPIGPVRGASARPTSSPAALRSAPLQNAFPPAPVTTSTRASSSPANDSTPRVISSAVSPSTALCASGRLIVSTHTRPRRSTSTFATGTTPSRQLVERALLGALVVPPPDERGGVAEAVALELVVADLAYQLRAERGPHRLLGAGPSRGATGSPALAERLRLARLVLRQLLPQALAFGGAERRRVAHEVEHALAVVQPQEERPD